MKDAKIYKGGKLYPKGYEKQLISTDLSIEFSEHPQLANREMKIEIPQDDRCEELSDKVIATINQLKREDNFKFFDEDEKGPSRIVVFDNKFGKKFDKNYKKDKDFDEIYLEWEKVGKFSVKNEKGGKRRNGNAIHCYNLKRVETYGVCEIESFLQPSTAYGRYVPINYGFCGSSCTTIDVRFLAQNYPEEWKKWNQDQWEMEAIYYEDENSEEFGRNQ